MTAYETQQAIRTKCLHPSGVFVEFKKEEVEQSIPSRFEKIVRKYPGRIAVKTESHALTYAELNATANRVARAILAQQGSEVAPVGLLFEKGAPLIAAMLGVLKAGKLFVLLDPSFPMERIVAVLENSQARLVVTDQNNVASAAAVASSDCQLMEFESIDSVIAPDDLGLHISPKALAYIIYTSGSTGEPKGVIQDHKNLMHNMMLRTNASSVSVHDRIVLLTSGTANAVTNTFFALLNGAALLPFDVKKEGVAPLANWLLRERITFLWISSPLFRNFAETLTGEKKFPDLRHLRLMSETSYKTDVDLYKKYFSSNCLLVNGLHSSETGPLRFNLIDHNTEIADGEVPVGYPVEDKEILLLDDEGKEVGFNHVGEIVVRSRYLSPGYWRRPDLTEAKFKPDPEGGDRRLYFTGDLGLLLPDGCLIHKGRKDFRVKIRGYGVEIAEVEKALRKHTAVREVVVVARQNELRESYLVAYFTAQSEPGPSVSEVRGFLKEKLADYMIPSAFVMLDTMPLTPNGKIDRKVLPAPGRTRPELDAPFVSPRTSVQKELARVWAEILGKESVGMQDNFFDLGGDSLLATKILTRIQDFFDVDLPLSTLLDKPTIAELAESIAQIRPEHSLPYR